MIPAKPPGPSSPAGEPELRLRWLRAQPLLVLAFVLVPGFAAALVITLMVFGLALELWGLVPLLFISGGPVVVAGWLVTHKDEWWLTPQAWHRRALWLTILVCFGLLPATGYWTPVQWWIWPLVLTLCVLLPFLSWALAHGARRAFQQPLTGDLGENGFQLHFDLIGIPGHIWLDQDALRWHLNGTGVQVSVLYKAIDRIAVGEPQRTDPPRLALTSLSGSGGVPLPPGPVLAVTSGKSTVLLPVQEPEAVAEILRRRKAFFS